MKKGNYFLYYSLIIYASLLISFSLTEVYQESLSQSNSDLNNDNNTTTSSIINLSESTIPNTINYSTYKDIGFQIQYPSEWEFFTENSKSHTVASFKPINEEIQVDVKIIPQDEYKSLKEFKNKKFKESDDHYTLLAYYRNSTTTLANQPALKEIYLITHIPTMVENTFENISSTSKALTIATFIESKKSFYEIVYFAPSEIFSYYLPTIEQMIKSFQIDQSDLR